MVETVHDDGVAHERQVLDDGAQLYSDSLDVRLSGSQ